MTIDSEEISASKSAQHSRSRSEDKQNQVLDDVITTSPKKKRLQKRKGTNKQTEKREYELRSSSPSKKKEDIIDAQNTMPMNSQIPSNNFEVDNNNIQQESMILEEKEEKTQQIHTIIDLKPLEKLSSSQDDKKEILQSFLIKKCEFFSPI